jgi:hypothetical protein
MRDSREGQTLLPRRERRARDCPPYPTQSPERDRPLVSMTGYSHKLRVTVIAAARSTIHEGIYEGTPN